MATKNPATSTSGKGENSSSPPQNWTAQQDASLAQNTVAREAEQRQAEAQSKAATHRPKTDGSSGAELTNVSFNGYAQKRIPFPKGK